MLALIFGGVPVVVVMSFPRARVQCTIERFFLVDPELKIASCFICVAGKSYLWYPRRNLLQNGLICDITHLKVLLDHKALLITHTTFSFGHQGIASLVRAADVAIDTFPALIAVAGITLSRRAVLTICERPTQRGRAVVSSEAWWA